MRQSAIDFKSRGVALEGVVASPEGLPEGSSGVPKGFPGVVVCHPHPLFGGDMDNGFVVTVCRALVEEGFVTLRFNFRGVGKSEGTFTKGPKGARGTEGEDEQADVVGVLAVLRAWPGVNRGRVGLAGYSFGASVVLAGISLYKAARAFVLISPTLTAMDHNGVGGDTRPKVFIVGDRDRLVPYTSLKERVDSLKTPAGLQVVPGADHSWRGYETEAAEQAARFFVGALGR